MHIREGCTLSRKLCTSTHTHTHKRDLQSMCAMHQPAKAMLSISKKSSTSMLPYECVGSFRCHKRKKQKKLTCGKNTDVQVFLDVSQRRMLSCHTNYSTKQPQQQEHSNNDCDLFWSTYSSWGFTPFALRVWHNQESQLKEWKLSILLVKQNHYITVFLSWGDSLSIFSSLSFVQAYLHWHAHLHHFLITQEKPKDNSGTFLFNIVYSHQMDEG